MMDEGRKLPAAYRNTGIIKASTAPRLWLVPIKKISGIFGKVITCLHSLGFVFDAIYLMSVSCPKGSRMLMPLLEDRPWLEKHLGLCHIHNALVDAA